MLNELYTYKSPSPYCKKCNHTGKIPFEKNGKEISHAFVYCECHKEEEYQPPVTPDDIDFPCSYDWRAYYEWTIYGRHLPPLEPPIDQPTEELPYKVRGLTYKERDEINQLKANFLYLDKKFNNIEKEVKTFLDKKRQDTYSIE